MVQLGCKFSFTENFVCSKETGPYSRMEGGKYIDRIFLAKSSFCVSVCVCLPLSQEQILVCIFKA